MRHYLKIEERKLIIEKHISNYGCTCPICGYEGEAEIDPKDGRPFALTTKLRKILDIGYERSRFEFDHIKPIASGGNNGIENYQLLCPFCNKSKGGKMPRARLLDKRIGKSKKFNTLLTSHIDRLVYLMMYPFTDCEGRLNVDPDELKIEVFPLLRISPQRIAKAVIELDAIKLGILYEDEKTKIPIFQFAAFHDFQNIRRDKEPNSRYSSPQKGRPQGGPTPSLYLNKYKLKRKERGGVVRKSLGVNFDLEARKFVNITQNDIDGWKKAYPACDIEIELLKAKEWVLSNWASGKGQKKNWRKFITNWLTRAQDQGGTKGVKRTGELPPDLRAWVEREKK